MALKAQDAVQQTLTNDAQTVGGCNRATLLKELTGLIAHSVKSDLWLLLGKTAAGPRMDGAELVAETANLPRCGLQAIVRVSFVTSDDREGGQ